MKKLFTILSLAITSFVVAQSPAKTQTTVVTGLAYPVAFDVTPDGRFLITLKGDGSNTSTQNSKIVVYSAAGTLIGNFYNLSDSTNSDFERGLLGICIDPNFATNHYIYAYYNHLYAGDERIRVVRFTEVSNVGTNPFLVLDIDVSNSIAGNHVGGNVRMHASEPDKIYIAIGDLAYQQGNTSLNYAQFKTNPYGKILRMNVDGTIPNDNPFYDDGNPATGNDDRIWSYGHRNPFDFTFSPVNDSLYSAENGWNTWDETNIIRKGGNYGWNTCEGAFLLSSTSNPCNNALFTNPLATWGSPLPAVTGIIMYGGTAFPTLTNHLLIADNDVGNITNITLGNAPAYNTLTSKVTWFDATTTGGLTTLHEAPDGCIWAMKGGYTTNGQIYRICPVGMSTIENNSFISSMNIGPNPFDKTCTLNFTLIQKTEVSVELFDVQGKKVSTISKSNLEKGVQSFEINKNKLQLDAGFYFCTVTFKSESGTWSKTEKIIVE